MVALMLAGSASKRCIAACDVEERTAAADELLVVVSFFFGPTTNRLGKKAGLAAGPYCHFYLTA